MAAKRGSKTYLYGFLADDQFHRDVEAYRRQNGILKESEALRILVRKGLQSETRNAAILEAAAGQPQPAKTKTGVSV